MASMIALRGLPRNYLVLPTKRQTSEWKKISGVVACRQKHTQYGQLRQSHLLPVASCGNNIHTPRHLDSSFNPVAYTSIRNFHRSVALYDDNLTVNTPPFAESVSEGEVNWHKAAGNEVEEDDVVCHLETDKTSINVSAPKSGVIVELLVEDGKIVTAGTPLFTMKPGAVSASEKPSEAEKPAASPAPPQAAPPSGTAGPIPSSMPPPPPLPQTPMSSVPVSSLPPPSPVTMTTGVPSSMKETRVKMTPLKRKTGERLKQAMNINASTTTFNEIDMTNIIELRKTYQDQFVKKHGIKMGFMSAFVKAATHALLNQPLVNAVIDDKEIVYRDYVDISVAVASPKGLVVPVIRDCQNMNYADIERTIVSLGTKARNGTLDIGEMQGGTFTITNGGVFGSLNSIPVINYGQSAILGMHKIQERPVVINNQILIRPMMYVAMTYDHRLIDGANSVPFLLKIKEGVEDPRIILLDL